MPKSSPVNRSNFNTFRTLQTRLGDMDMYGHVNNVYYFTYFDTAINGWYIENGMLDLHQSPGVYLVVENGCQFFSEIRFPQTVHAGIRLLNLGNASVRYQIALFVEGCEKAAAQGEYVHVFVDRQTNRPQSIPADHRALLEAL